MAARKPSERASLRKARSDVKKQPAERHVMPRDRARASGNSVLVLSGPNLQRLGKREPEIYGRQTLDDIHVALHAAAASLGASVTCRQSNHEGTLVDWIGSAQDEGFDAIVLNPAAYTHTSYALLDAVLAAGVPTVEVHLSNPDAREEFRRHSCVAPGCVGRIAGFGTHSYLLGLSAILEVVASQRRA